MQGLVDGAAHIVSLRIVEPIDIRGQDSRRIVPALLHQGPRQQQGQLGIIGRLTGQVIPGAAVKEMPATAGIHGRNTGN